MSKLPLESMIFLCNCHLLWLGAERGLEVVPLVGESLPMAALLLETWSRQPCLRGVFGFLEMKIKIMMVMTKIKIMMKMGVKKGSHMIKELQLPGHF